MNIKTIEEKAKAYDKALDWMRELYPGLHGATKEGAEHYFPELRESEDEKIRKGLIEALKTSKTVGELKFTLPEPTREEWIAYLEKQKEQKQKMTPKWLYRLEFKDESCGLWYDGNGKWCFESGIGSIEGCKTKTLPMEYDERYKQDGRDWFSSCSRKEDLMHWYSLQDAEKLISKGFVFTRYLATEYHEYDQQTVFIKETSLYREEIDIFELFKQKPAEWSEEDEKIRNLAIEWAETMYGQFRFVDMGSTDFRKIVAWLKSLRPQPHWKPSEEQMIALDGCLEHWSGNKSQKEILESLYEQLKTLK